MLRVLGHLETGRSHAAGVDRLARGEEDAIMLEEVDGARLAAHVGHLTAAPAAIGLQLLGIILGKLVLESTRKGDVARDAPRLLAGREEGLVRETGRHVLHAVAVRRAHHEHIVDHLLGDTRGDGADAVRAGDGHHLGAELESLDAGAPGHVAEAGDRHLAALDVLARVVQQVLGEIERAEARGFRAQDAAAPGGALAGQHAGIVFARELLVHTVEEADFAAAHAHIAGRDVLVGADTLPELQHEGLAETHDLGVGLALGIEIAAALGTAHREGREGVLEGLLEAEELQHGGSHGAVEAQAALVGTDGAVELDAVAGVGLDLALVIGPRHAEREDAVRLDHPLDDLRLLEFRMLVIDFLDALEHLLYRLQIFAFAGVLGLETGHDVFRFHD